jgi:hypothetical protein
MRHFIAAALLLAATSTSATVPRFNPRAPENNQVLASFNYNSVEPVLAAIGARYQRSGTASAPSLLVTFANGRRATLSMGACNADGSTCRSLNIHANWTRIANSPPQRVSEAVERFNRQYSFAKAYFTSDGRPAMQRYLTADYGYVRGNLAINLLVFATQVDRFARDVLAPLETPR